MARMNSISRLVLAAVLSTGVAAAVAPSAAFAKKEEKAPPKSQASKEFAAAAQPLEAKLNTALATPELKAAKEAALAASSDPAKLAAAQANVDTVLGGLVQQVQGLEAVATTPADKQVLGQWLFRIGAARVDAALQYKGVKLVLDSGLLSPQDLPAVEFSAGQAAYFSGDYNGAVSYLRQAYDAGYRAPNNQTELTLMDAYKKAGNAAAAIAFAKADVEAARAKGTPPSEALLRSAVGAAYEAKDLSQTAELGSVLLQYYPDAKTWSIAIAMVRQLGRFPKIDNLDLMRLMELSGGLSEKADYAEYLEDVNPRAFPGEAIRILDKGVAAGNLTSADFASYRSDAMARVTSDKASLPAQAAEASKPGAAVDTLVATGDVFLSYDDPAKAEAFYTRALGMPGVPADKVNLHLAMSQVAQGKFADALPNFQKVSGSLKPIATMWLAYARSKAGA